MSDQQLKDAVQTAMRDLNTTLSALALAGIEVDFYIDSQQGFGMPAPRKIVTWRRFFRQKEI